VLWNEEERRQRGVDLIHVDRGGDVTYHGPGQLVMYPILHLANRRWNLHQYLRALEEIWILTLADFGIPAGRVKGCTGVWVAKDRTALRVTPEGFMVDGAAAKIAAIGIKVSQWVTLHGVAFNVSPDLEYFKGIIPCGLVGQPVTSLTEIMGREVSLEETASKARGHAGRVFGMSWESLSLEALRSLTA